MNQWEERWPRALIGCSEQAREEEFNMAWLEEKREKKTCYNQVASGVIPEANEAQGQEQIFILFPIINLMLNVTEGISNWMLFA